MGGSSVPEIGHELPVRVRIGVTGHRELESPLSVRATVDKLLHDWTAELSSMGKTSVVFTAVSAIAEGADRIVAEAVLATPRSTLDVVLPVKKKHYSSDFSGESLAEFERLHDLADWVIVVTPRYKRPHAYGAAGRAVVDRCDMLIAVWDSERSPGKGGTAEAVNYAMGLGVPVTVIDPSGSIVSMGSGIPESVAAMFGEFDEFNAITSGPESPNDPATDDPESEFSDVPTDHVRACMRWSAKYFAPADSRAIALRRRYSILADLAIVLSALSVVVLAFHVAFAPEATWWAILESVMLLVVLVIVVAGRRTRIHERWLAFRFVAERVRSASYLAAAGWGREVSFVWSTASGEIGLWATRLLEEIWRRVPETDVVARSSVVAVRDFLVEDWVDVQEAYHRTVAHRHRNLEQVITGLTVALFAVTLVAAVAHGFELGVHSQVGPIKAHELGVFFALALPAVAAGLGGIQLRRDAARTAERSENIQRRLHAARYRLASAVNVKHLRAFAREIDNALSAESSDWVRFQGTHDLELRA